MKTAKEILEKKGITTATKHHDYQYLYKAVLQAMEEYASQQSQEGQTVLISIPMEEEPEPIEKGYIVHFKDGCLMYVWWVPEHKVWEEAEGTQYGPQEITHYYKNTTLPKPPTEEEIIEASRTFSSLASRFDPEALKSGFYNGAKWRDNYV